PFSNLNGSTMSFVIVLATPVNVNAPIKFITDAKIIAVLGVKARVEIAVATALAVSWKPLIKSNINEKITIATVIIKIYYISYDSLAIFHYYCFKVIRYSLTFISNFF